jgi:CBS domain containing-hemolysin-like protein
VEREGDLRFWVSGRLTLDDLSEAVGHDFRRDDVTTVGGLILDVLGRVPRAGEALALGPFRVRVERVVRRKIQRVFLERIAPSDADAVAEEPA